jgi:hypothetical protein
VSYDAWNTDRYNWVDMQKHLFDAPDAPVGGARAEAEEDFDAEDEDAGADEGDGGDYDGVDSGDFDDLED